MDTVIYRLSADGLVYSWVWPCSNWGLSKLTSRDIFEFEYYGITYAIEESEALAQIEHWEERFKTKAA